MTTSTGAPVYHTLVSHPELNKLTFSLNPVFAFLHALGDRRAKQVYDNIKNGVVNTFTCYSCEMVVRLAKLTVFSVNELNYLMAGVCESFKFEDRRVCSGLSDLFADELYYIFKHTNLTKAELCATLIGAQCLTNPCAKQEEWLINLEPNYRPIVANNSITVTESSPKTYRILHLSDLHIDPFYSTSADSQCGEPLCCRTTSAAGKRRAGHWGDYYSCDSPKYTIESLMRYINHTFGPTTDDQYYQYVIWTGDITAHDVWNTTRGTIVNGSRALTGLIRDYIGAGKMVFPVVGNHEGLPVNQFPPPEVQGPLSNAWLYRELLNQWSQWIPEEYNQTFLTYGYYANDVSDKLKVIVLNTNYCARINFWLMLNPNDPGDQLKWLVRQLARARAAGQSVHIIGHIPPDNINCVSTFVHNYLRIIEMYQDTIIGQFFGHTHFDEYRVFYSPTNNSVPTGMAYLAPSITPYESVNPAFRFYTINSSGTILDHQNYYINLTQANANDQLSPVWIAEYTARQSYNMSSLSADNWHQLLDNMKSDDQLFQLYYNYYHRFSDAFNTNFTQYFKQQLLNAISVTNPISCNKSNYEYKFKPLDV